MVKPLKFISENQRGCLCCLGGFLLLIIYSVDYSYSNLNTYMVSYMRQNGHNANLGYQDFVFVTGSKNVIQGALTFVGGLVSMKIGVRGSMFLGCIIMRWEQPASYKQVKMNSVGYSCTYFSLESVFPVAVLTTGVVHGLGFVLTYAVAIGTAQKWFHPDIRGFMGSLVVR